VNFDKWYAVLICESQKMWMGGPQLPYVRGYIDMNEKYNRPKTAFHVNINLHPQVHNYIISAENKYTMSL